MPWHCRTAARNAACSAGIAAAMTRHCRLAGLQCRHSGCNHSLREPAACKDGHCSCNAGIADPAMTPAMTPAMPASQDHACLRARTLRVFTCPGASPSVLARRTPWLVGDGRLTAARGRAAALSEGRLAAEDAGLRDSRTPWLGDQRIPGRPSAIPHRPLATGHRPSAESSAGTGRASCQGPCPVSAQQASPSRLDRPQPQRTTSFPGHHGP